MNIPTNTPMTPQDLLALMCKHTNKYGLYVSFDLGDALDASQGPGEDALKDASNGRLSFAGKTAQLASDNCGFFLFDTRKEMDDAYLDFIGADGPTSRNAYSGPYKIYATTCNNEGVFERENT